MLRSTKNPRWIQPWMGTTLSLRPVSVCEASEHALTSGPQTYFPAEKHTWDSASPISQHSSTSSFSQSSTHSSSPSSGRILSLDSVPFSGGNNHASFHHYNSSGEGSTSFQNSSGEFARASAAAGESMPSSFATTNSTAFSCADDQDSLTTMCSSHDGGSSIFSTSHGSGHMAASGGCRCAFHAKASGANAAAAEQRGAQQDTQHDQHTQYTHPTQYTQPTQFSQIPYHHASQKAG